MNKILNESTEGNAKRDKIDALTTAAKKRLDAKRDSLKQLEAKARAAAAKDPKSAEIKKFQTEQQSFMELARQEDSTIKKQVMDSTKTLTEKTLKIIEDYASKQKIDLVMDKGQTGRSPLLFGNEDLDITEEILDKVNG